MLKVRLDNDGTEPAKDYTVSCIKGNENLKLCIGFFTYERTVPAVSLVSDRMSYGIRLSGLWYDIIILNMHAVTEDKSDGMNDSFYEEISWVFSEFPNYHMKNLLEDFNVNVGTENIFKCTIGNDRLL